MPESPDRPARPSRAPAGRPGRPSSTPRSGPSARGSQPGRRPASREEIAQRTYDPRREERRKASRVPLPDDVDPRELDAEARRELRSLTKETAELVARHLVMTGRLLDDEPGQALAHARAARALAGRVGVVREAAGLAAYAAGEWSEALSELRAARRITGSPEHLAVFADCERGLGRPERALAYGDDPQLPQLSQDARVELAIVLAGARRDLGQPDAAVVALQDPSRRTTDKRPWAARLWYAYADALVAAGREEQAREWFGKAAAADAEGQTDAGDRLLELEGVVLDDGDDADLAPTELPSEAELAELVAGIPALTERLPAPAAEPPDEDPVAPVVGAVAEPGFRPAEELPAEDAASPAAGPVALPPFAAPLPDGRDTDEDGELRLFD